MDPLADGDVARRLLHPGKTAAIDALAEAWRIEAIEVVLPGYGALLEARNLLQKVRGALGEALLAGASDNVRARRPCDWQPPCAAEIFFGRKPAVRIDGYDSEIPKPFVLSGERVGQDLHLRLTVFGFACGWCPAVTLALADALRNRVLWRRMAADLAVFIPREVRLARLRSLSTHGLELADPPTALRIDFQAPVDAERGSALDEPEILFRRLVRRVALLARWQDVDLAIDERELERAVASCRFAFLDDVGRDGQSAYGRGGHRLMNAVCELPSIDVSGELRALWPYLLIGETTHLGRGASIGLGKYRVTPA